MESQKFMLFQTIIKTKELLPTHTEQLIINSTP